MARTGSFPLRVAYGLLRENVSSSSFVFDPFCGKGTTLLAARLLGASAFGMDIAPEAVVCSSAKMVNLQWPEIEGYIESLNATPLSTRSVPDAVRGFFHEKTLGQILRIRNQLLADMTASNSQTKDLSTITMAALLGILHGHASYSLSISSAHAFAMAPAYVQRYARRKKLAAPLRDVKICIIRKLIKCLTVPLPKPVKYAVRSGSAMDCRFVFPELSGKVDVILTSPPYLNAQTYSKDNWLRLWLLGYDYKTIGQKYFETGSVDLYVEWMTRVFEKLGRLLKRGGKLILVGGSVRRPRPASVKKHFMIHTIGLLAQACELSKAGLQITSVSDHIVPSGRRYLHSLSNSNGHAKRDLRESVLVAFKT